MDKPEDAAGMITTRLISKDDIEKEHASALRRHYENIQDAKRIGFQRAIELLRSEDARKHVDYDQDNTTWADWLEKRGME